MESCPNRTREVEISENWQRCVVSRLPFEEDELYCAMASLSTFSRLPVFKEDTSRSLEIINSEILMPEQKNYLSNMLQCYLALSEDVSITWF
jgi:hypothetical protein